MEEKTAAERIARHAHAEQVDLQGKPYVDHLERVAKAVEAMGGTPEMVEAAWLHDVMEDHGYSAAQLLGMGVSGAAVRLVEILTHDSAYSYRTYIDFVVADKEARRIKLADSMDNLARNEELAPDVAERYQKRYLGNIKAIYKAMIGA